MGRPREHDETTRVALLDAAEKILADQGAGALSVRSVADAIGTSTRAVYSLFGGKPGLVSALHVRGMQILEAFVVGLPVTDDPAHDLVRCGFDAFRRYAVEHPNLFRLTFERLDPDLEFGLVERKAAHSAWKQLRERVRRCDEAGLLEGRDLGIATWQFHAFAQGLASVELRGWLPAGTSPETYWRTGLEAFVFGAVAPRRKTRRR